MCTPLYWSRNTQINIVFVDYGQLLPAKSSHGGLAGRLYQHSCLYIVKAQIFASPYSRHSLATKFWQKLQTAHALDT